MRLGTKRNTFSLPFSFASRVAARELTAGDRGEYSSSSLLGWLPLARAPLELLLSRPVVLMAVVVEPVVAGMEGRSLAAALDCRVDLLVLMLTIVVPRQTVPERVSLSCFYTAVCEQGRRLLCDGCGEEEEAEASRVSLAAINNNDGERMGVEDLRRLLHTHTTLSPKRSTHQQTTKGSHFFNTQHPPGTTYAPTTDSHRLCSTAQRPSGPQRDRHHGPSALLLLM